MVKHLLPKLCLVAVAFSAGSIEAIASEDTQALVAKARSAAPPSISDNATIIVKGKQIVKGSNGWTCLPDTFPDDGMPMCNDAVWMEMLDALINKKDFKADRIGISYMLQGDLGAGVSNSDHHLIPQEALQVR